MTKDLKMIEFSEEARIKQQPYIPKPMRFENSIKAWLDEVDKHKTEI